MIDIGRLKVSLTKNGYLKIADVVKLHPRWEVLDYVEGHYPGINIQRSQVKAVLGADSTTGQVPECWDEIRQFDDQTIESFTLVAVILSHHRLIELLKMSNQGGMRGFFHRDDLAGHSGGKIFTNLKFAMAALNLCDYDRGAESISYDFYPLIYCLSGAHAALKELVYSKLERCRWVDPFRHRTSPYSDFFTTCNQAGFPEVFGLTQEEFAAWLEGTLDIDPPDPDAVQRTRIPTRFPR